MARATAADYSNAAQAEDQETVIGQGHIVAWPPVPQPEAWPGAPLPPPGNRVPWRPEYGEDGPVTTE